MKSSTASLRAYLVDDEVLALKRLNKLLATTGSVEVLGSTTDQAKAISFLESHKIDVLFLDIKMPGMNGFELLAKLGTQPVVIFTTAYDRYALKAFEVNSVDYLLKPIGVPQLERALEKVRRLGETASAIQMRAQIHSLALSLADDLASEARHSSNRISFRVGNRILLIDLDRITHFWSEDKVTFATTDEGSKYITDHSITDLEQKLGSKGFVRIHRATLVNLTFIDELHRWFGGRMVIRMKDKNQTKLTVSRVQARILRDRLGL
jgi:two-component system, LytTR family, response regulator